MIVTLPTGQEIVVPMILEVRSLALEDVEHAAITRAMELCKNNRSRAAHMLRIDRRTLYRKMEKLGIVLPAWVPEYAIVKQPVEAASLEG